jgi:hypothetical protein
MKVMWGGVGGTYVALETSHCDGTRDAPKEGDLHGNGVPIVVVEVTILRARMGEPSQGRRGTGGQTEAAMRYAKCGEPKVVLKVTCCCEATRLTAGERA